MPAEFRNASKASYLPLLASFWGSFFAAWSLDTFSLTADLYIIGCAFPVSGYLSAILYLGAHSLLVWDELHLRAAYLAIWEEAVRDGPSLEDMYDVGMESFFTHVGMVAGSLAVVALGMLPNPTHRQYLGTLALLIVKWAWAETLPRVVSGLWRGHLASWGMAAAGAYFGYDWRLLLLVAARRICLGHIKSAILRPRRQPNALPYAYSNITSPRTIRLLKIEPRLLGMRCSLVNHNLDTEPPAKFEAISYRWGSDAKLRVLKIDGKALHIPVSAYDVLWARASLWRTRLMWIDAICVNQDDNDDKNQQVGLMREIYDRAARTIVWLGDAPDAALVSSFLVEMFAQLENGMSDAEVALAHSGLKRIRDDNPKWKALERMLVNPYWSRVWIVQEIVVSRQVHIRYGGRWFDWDFFSSVIGALTENSPINLLKKLDVSEGMATPPFQAIRQIQAIETLREDYQAGFKWPLPRILVHFNNAKATLGLDHVFGFQGVSAAAEDKALVPDYQKPTLDVFRETTLYSLAQPPSLMMLSVAGTTQQQKLQSSPGWPSWVPDFQLIPELAQSTPPLLHLYEAYQAGGGFAPSFSTSPQAKNELVIRGMLIDEIGAVTQLMPIDRSRLSVQGFGEMGSDNRKHAAGLLIQEAARMREAQDLSESRCMPTYFNGQSRWDAFWRTYLANQSLTSYPADATDGEHLRNYMGDSELAGKGILDGAIKTLSNSPRVAAALAAMNRQETVGPGVTAEDTFRTLEKLLPVPPELGGLGAYLTPELLGDRRALFQELAAATDLPYWARKTIQDDLLSPGTHDVSKAAEELYMRAFDFSNPSDTTLVRRVVLVAAFLQSGRNLSLSDDQIRGLRETVRIPGMVAPEERLNMLRVGRTVGTTARQRQFAVTRSGYMALVPVDTAAGDLVCIFLGAKVPHVIRKAGDAKYRLVGEAYLHGFMHGEAWRGSRAAEDITLI